MDPSGTAFDLATALPNVHALSDLEVRPELAEQADLLIRVSAGPAAQSTSTDSQGRLRVVRIPDTEFPSVEELQFMRLGVQTALTATQGLSLDHRVIVQCRAGISRAPALAWAIMVQMGFGIQDSYRLLWQRRPQVLPSRAVLYLADEFLGLDWDLARAGARVHTNFRRRLERAMRGEDVSTGSLLDPPTTGRLQWA